MDSGEFARMLRRQMPDAEKFLWRQLRNRQFKNFKFRRQFSVGAFVADFVCLDRRLIIELDGGQHTLAREYDARRTAYLKSQGFRMLRFWNHEVLGDWDAVAEEIWRKLKENPSPPAPLPQGERGEEQL